MLKAEDSLSDDEVRFYRDIKKINPEWGPADFSKSMEMPKMKVKRLQKKLESHELKKSTIGSRKEGN